MSKALIADRLSLVTNQLDLLLRVRGPSRRWFNPRVKIRIETDQYIIKTAESRAELLGALRLRYQVFYRELAGKWASFPPFLDVDSFDLDCDHIIITDPSGRKVIGTYRLLSSLFHDRFYSETEFDLRPLSSLRGVKLELGRACVDPVHRTGPVINLLWRGIAEYARNIQASWLFGCTSLKTMDSREIGAVMEYLGHKDRFHPTLRIPALPAFRWQEDSSIMAEMTEEERHELGRSQVPRLLLSYFRAGARLCSDPAIDRSLRCTDFLTLLKMDELDGLFSRRFELS